MTSETKQISDNPPRFETLINMHSYTNNNSGWYRVEIIGMGRTELEAQTNAQERLDKALIAISVVRSTNRVPEASGVAEG